jgi:hypothetical protein
MIPSTRTALGWASFTVPLALAASCTLSGCTEEVKLDAKVVEATNEKYLIEVKTQPGVKVNAGSASATADEQGVAKLEVKPSDIGYMGDSRSLSLDARGGGMLKSYFGFGEVELPFSPKEAADRPEGDDWLKIQGGGNDIDQDAGALWLFEKVGGAYTNKKGGLDLEVLGPPKAKIRLAGKSASADELGKGVLRFEPAEVLAMISSSDVGGYEPYPVEASVQVGDGPVKPVALKGQWNVRGPFLRRHIEGLVAKPLGGAREAEALILYVDLRDFAHAVGRKGTLATPDVVATGKAQHERKLSDCDGYQMMKGGKPYGEPMSLPRVAIDEEVIAYDAHTGKELARKVFPARETCPVEKRSSEATLKVYPDSLTVLAWLQETAKGGQAKGADDAAAKAP